MKFPTISNPPAAPPSGPSEVRSTTPNRKAVILVVEDEAIIRMGAVAMVVYAGHEALEAANADEAIRLLETRPDIHLVFTDVQMPGTMDGIKLSHYIRDRWPPVRLIVASGNDVVEGNLPTGARFFRKPYNDNEMIALMGMMLGNGTPGN